MLGYVAIAFAIANVVQHQSIIVTFKSSVIVIVMVMTPKKRKQRTELTEVTAETAMF